MLEPNTGENNVKLVVSSIKVPDHVPLDGNGTAVRD